MEIHRKLPEGSYKPKYEAEFYRLLPRKRQLYENNRELRKGLRYLIWSRYSRCWWERVLSDTDTEENIRYYLSMGWLVIWPTEEQKQDIRDEVEREQLGYWTLNYRRQTEMDHERHKMGKKVGNGDKYWLKYRQEQINKLKKKKK